MLGERQVDTELCCTVMWGIDRVSRVLGRKQTPLGQTRDQGNLVVTVLLL